MRQKNQIKRVERQNQRRDFSRLVWHCVRGGAPWLPLLLFVIKAKSQRNGAKCDSLALQMLQRL